MLQFNLHSEMCQQITTRIVQTSEMTFLTIFYVHVDTCRIKENRHWQKVCSHTNRLKINLKVIG